MKPNQRNAPGPRLSQPQRVERKTALGKHVSPRRARPLRLEQPRSGAAFTLIEMLVVIAVIGLMATMVMGLLPRAAVLKVRSRVRSEMAQLDTAIDSYKEKRGFYPPDNPSNPGTNSLYYELVGTTFNTNNNTYTTLTGDGSPPLPATSVSATFGAGGFINSKATPEGDARNFHQQLNIRSQVKTNVVNNVSLLGVSIKGPGGDFSPWYYNSSNPTHNPNGFDLWVEVLLNGKPKIFGNWKED